MRIGRNKRFHKPDIRARRPRVFISHRHRDEGQVSFFRSQRKRTCLDYIDYSIKKPYHIGWKSSAKYRIKNSDVCLVAIGPTTHRSKSVKKEVMLAKRYKKPIIGIKLKNRVKIPDYISNNGKVVNWDCKALQKMFEGFRKKRRD
ncbi:MAG: TIR domain-containing protein [Candidatus Methanomethylophilaceae archaeon]